MPRYVYFFCYYPNPFIYRNYKECVYLYMYIFMQTMKHGRMCSLCNWTFSPLRYSSTIKNCFSLWRTVITVRRGLSLSCNRGHRNRINKHVGFSRKCNKQYIRMTQWPHQYRTETRILSNQSPKYKNKSNSKPHNNNKAIYIRYNGCQCGFVYFRNDIFAPMIWKA